MVQPDKDIRLGRVTRFLEKAPNGVFMAYAITAAFITYFAMYAFRKPFTAATFEGETWFGGEVGLKAVLASSQLIGYALSKVIGIKVCAELRAEQRMRFLIGLILVAEASLLIFGALPNDFKFLPLVVNGLCLGVVWGVVVSFLEGRRTSEVLLAGLSCSFIMASGIVKDFGVAVMSGDGAMWWHGTPWLSEFVVGWMGAVSEGWMPFVVGLHYLPVFCLAAYMLGQIPAPDTKDVLERVERTVMDGASRKRFVKRFAVGLFLLCGIYILLTAYREFRDTYLVDLFSELGYDDESEVKGLLGRSETIVGFVVTGGLALIYWLRKLVHGRGLLLVWLFMLSGLVALAGGTWMFQVGRIDGFQWMVVTGVGVYLTYVPYGSVLFDEIISETKYVGTAVFAIYLCDSLGYLASVLMYMLRGVLFGGMEKLAFFQGFTWLITGVGAVCLVGSYLYFAREAKKAQG